MYNIVEWDNQPVEEELQKVDPAADNLFKIEYVIKYKGHKKRL